MADFKYVLKNDGNIVRLVSWKHDGPMYIVLDREDSRVHFLSDDLLVRENGNRYNLISKTTAAEVKAGPITIKPGLTFHAEKHPQLFDRSMAYKPDSTELYEETLRWSFVGHVAVLVLLLALGFYFKDDGSNELEVVQVVKQIRPIKSIKKQAPKTVAVSKKKISKRRKAKFASKKQKKRSYKNRSGKAKKKVVVRKKFGSQGVSSNKGISYSRNNKKRGVRSGALAALNSPNQKVQGANLKNIGKAGKGYSKSKGQGRSTKALYGKGLQKSAFGNGKKVGRYSQGYSTRGIGGGGSAKYGEQNIRGGGGNYMQPLYTEALIQGGLDRSLVDSVIKRNRGKFTYCYEKGLQSQPRLSGRVSVKFVINPRGRVSTAKVNSSSVNSDPVEKCIVAQIRSLKFPKPVGNLNVRVTYPFQLHQGYLARR